MLKQYKLTMDTINRLQFRHHNEIFDTREEAIEYIYDKIKEEGEGLASEQNSPYSYSLFAEPTVLRYKNEEEETGCNFKKGPHIMLVIGSETNDTIYHDRNRFCIIDIDKTEDEIKNLEEELAKAVKSLTLAVFDTSTLDLHVEKTDDGTFLSGDVKTAETHVFDGIVKENNLMIVPFDDEAGPEGLFIYVDLTYDEASETFTFVVTNADGTLKKQSVKLPNNYLVSGEYKKSDESLHLHMKDGTDVVVNCEELIAEWAVEGEASKTPIVLTREEVAYDGTPDHHHVEPWQDVLRADVRISDMNTNILEKTSDGRYLFVDGKASNILYYWNGERTNVEDQLNKLNKMCRVSPDNDNIIKYVDEVGFFASAKLDYVTSENKLVFTTSSVNGEQIVKEITLNTVDVIEDIKYDPTTEELVIKYRNDKGEIKILRVPLSGLIDEWTVLNTGHSVKLNRQRNVSGADILTADVNISGLDNNILEERGEGDLHTLYVRGTADNIKYRETTVEGALDDLEAEDESINEKLQNEIDRSTTEDEKIETTIGSGFSTDAHETVTYKFEELQNQVNSEAEKLQNEIDRSEAKDTEHDGRLDAIDAEIGDGFGPRATVRDAIDALSADTAASLKDIINNDNSIGIDKTNPVKPIVKVNLSAAETNNTLRLESDGLYNFIDLSYNPDTNKLTLTRSDNASTENVTKDIQLNSVSFIDDITYDPATETLVITYHSGAEEKKVEINLGQIFQEWEVYNDPDSAVKLNRERVIDGKDKLSAEVIITTAHTDNVLENEHGALYVPANTFVTDALSGAIQSETARAIEADAELDRKIDAETTRATLEEGRIESKLDAEITRSTEKDTDLNNKIDNEIARATARETQLNDAITAETIRAQEADNDLYQKITEEKTRAEVAEANLQNAIDSETLIRISGDTALQHLIEDESERRVSGDTILLNKINTEEARARETETRIETALNNEIARAQAKEGELNVAITNETLRAQAADNELYQKIADETSDRATEDALLDAKINQEISRAQVAENSISERLNSEITRSTNEDQAIRNALDAEIDAREEGDAELEQAIRDATLTFANTTTAKMSKDDNNVVTTDVIVPVDDNIIIVDEGIKALVKLSYNAANNTLILEKTSASGHTYDTVQLNAGSIIESITYDNETKELVIRYESTSEPGVQHETRVGVSDLFNPWIINNPSEKSAIELKKTFRTGPLAEDELGGRVLITDDRDGDGKPDLGSNNIIEIRNNGLYVDGTMMSATSESVDCVQNELKVFEKAVIGHIIGNECGSGYTYEANNQATYINSATSFDNADFILDQSIKRVEIKIDDVIEDVDCIDRGEKKIYELLYGAGTSMPECGEGAIYTPDYGSCVISAATSFMDADKRLGDQICEILEMWTSGMTCTSTSDWIDDGANKKMLVDVRLSHGKYADMVDDDLVIEDMDGDYIDPTRTEFTDTNALRIICLQEGPSGITPDVATKQNGVYLSNVWDCGLYYGTTEEDQEAKAAASAAGYVTDPYNTDESSEASSFNYMNNVRQHDTLC